MTVMMKMMLGSDSVVAARIAAERVRLGGNRFAAAVETVAGAGAVAAVWCARSSVHCPDRTRCTQRGFLGGRYPCGTYHGTPVPHSTRPSAPRTDPGPSVFRVS